MNLTSYSRVETDAFGRLLAKKLKEFPHQKIDAGHNIYRNKDGSLNKMSLNPLLEAVKDEMNLGPRMVQFLWTGYVMYKVDEEGTLWLRYHVVVSLQWKIVIVMMIMILVGCLWYQQF